MMMNLGVMLSRRISWKIYGVGFKYYLAMDGKLTVYPDHISCLKLSWLLGRLISLVPLTTPEQPEPPLSEVSGVLYGKQKHNAELKYPQSIRRLNIFPASKTEVPYDSYCGCLYLRYINIFIL